MALIPIVTLPDPILRAVADPVSEITDGIRQLLEDMAETMYDAPGIGLAAPQINLGKRIIVMDCGSDEEPELYKMINPEIVSRSEELSILEEGCLSIPDHNADVQRPSIVEVKYTDSDGAERMISCDGLLGACVQHEIDHLNGVLFIDHISRLKRDMIVRRVMKAARQAGDDKPSGKRNGD